ncbi:MAG: hypothetical protein JO303_09525 [Caulobacteraceae bacterium]|nr:hypothetical protein [Caulobacteraceae bacterium]
MRTFNLVIQDARYLAPTHETATARDSSAARTLARRRLEASPHHLGVQVRDDDQLLFWLRRLGHNASAQPAAGYSAI